MKTILTRQISLFVTLLNIRTTIHNFFVIVRICLFVQSKTASINSRLNVVVRSPNPFGLGRNGFSTFRGSQLPRALLFFFRYAAPWTTAEGQHTAFWKSVACFLFLFSPVLLFPFFVSLFFIFSWWVVTFIPTLAPSFPALCALEMWPGGASQCNAAPAPNWSI